MAKPVVGILMGSDSDLPIMQEAAAMLQEFGIEYEMTIASAHRSPKKVLEYSQSAEKRGLKIIIAGAGWAAHLAGVVASHTTLPVIGVPIDSSPLKGLDALLATAQMPGGVPVATMSLGKAGAKNAGVFAAQIIAASDVKMSNRLKVYKVEMEREVEEKAKRLITFTSISRLPGQRRPRRLPRLPTPARVPRLPRSPPPVHEQEDEYARGSSCQEEAEAQTVEEETGRRRAGSGTGGVKTELECLPCFFRQISRSLNYAGVNGDRGRGIARKAEQVIEALPSMRFRQGHPRIFTGFCAKTRGLTPINRSRKPITGLRSSGFPLSAAWPLTRRPPGRRCAGCDSGQRDRFRHIRKRRSRPLSGRVLSLAAGRSRSQRVFPGSRGRTPNSLSLR